MPAGVWDRKYCCPEHGIAENRRSSDERRKQSGLEKEKHKMRSLVDSREHKKEIDASDATAIRNRINKSKSLRDLQDIEKDYPVMKLRIRGRKSAQ